MPTIIREECSAEYTLYGYHSVDRSCHMFKVCSDNLGWLVYWEYLHVVSDIKCIVFYQNCFLVISSVVP